MGAQTQEVFGRDSGKLVEAYLMTMNQGSINIGRMLETLEIVLDESIETNVRLGQLVAQHEPTQYTEIGCGLGIPSLTLEKLGYASDSTFDKSRGRVDLGKQLARSLGLHRTKYEVKNFRYWYPTMHAGSFLVAHNPAGEGSNGDLEVDVLELAIARNYNLALVPRPNLDESLRELSPRCRAESSLLKREERYCSRLRESGYNVKVHDIGIIVPANVIIAVK
mgnify:CR=1 FL=1|jgi:hypothetical protein